MSTDNIHTATPLLSQVLRYMHYYYHHHHHRHFLWPCIPARAMASFVSRDFLVTHNDVPQSIGSSGRVIILSQIPLPDNTQHTPEKHPCPRWDSNPRSQKVSGRIPTSYTTRPLGPALYALRSKISWRFELWSSELRRRVAWETSTNLKMEAVCSSKTLCHCPEKHITTHPNGSQPHFNTKISNSDEPQIPFLMKQILTPWF
jgi:hypothetical protein